MAFGNVLTVYQGNAETIRLMAEIIKGITRDFEIVESTFFIQTIDRDQTRALLAAIKDKNYRYTFLHIYNTDGSDMFTDGIDNAVANRIEDILFKDL